MRNWWIKFGCFLTGYNYGIVNVSSEATAKSVKRYTSALLIVCVLWFFIGYVFVQRYMYGTPLGSFAGGVIMTFIVIQIERQVILSIDPPKLLYWARGLIAALMAILGSVIIDQIIFKDDIEIEKITYLNQRVDDALPPKTNQIRSQIAALDTAIIKKDSERLNLIAEVTKNPFIRSTASQTNPTIVNSSIRDSTGKVVTEGKVVMTTTAVTSNIPNPKQQLIAPLEQTLTYLRKQKSDREDSLLNIRPALEKEFKSKVGFLDELKLMFKLISGSDVALGVWLIWFLFLMGIEMLVLFSKIGEKTNDYNETIKHQMELQMKKLVVLSRLAVKE
ncbi:MAG TPA: DUF4407 domain-containing protein [Puia sp.]|nr:DUF4407 domain-containing protein [Puia sp.]